MGEELIFQLHELHPSSLLCTGSLLSRRLLHQEMVFEYFVYNGPQLEQIFRLFFKKNVALKIEKIVQSVESLMHVNEWITYRLELPRKCVPRSPLFGPCNIYHKHL